MRLSADSPQIKFLVNPNAPKAAELAARLAQSIPDASIEMATPKDSLVRSHAEPPGKVARVFQMAGHGAMALGAGGAVGALCGCFGTPGVGLAAGLCMLASDRSEGMGGLVYPVGTTLVGLVAGNFVSAGFANPVVMGACAGITGLAAMGRVVSDDLREWRLA